MKQKLVDLYKEMADLTKPECMKCPGKSKTRCCESMYCDMAEDRAKEWDIQLLPRKNKTDLFLDSSGTCLVPPHLRPLCAIHLCQLSTFGLMPNGLISLEWTDKYFELRNEISELEYELMQ